MWFVGFFEGEGCFSIKTNRNRLEVSLQVSQSEKNNGKLICQKLQEKFGGGVCFSKRTEGKYSMWIWGLCKKSAVVNLMNEILPLCQCRKAEFNKKLNIVQSWISKNLIKICPFCNLKFTAKQKNAKYCSKICQSRHSAKRYVATERGKEVHQRAALKYYYKKRRQKLLA